MLFFTPFKANHYAQKMCLVLLLIALAYLVQQGVGLNERMAGQKAQLFDVQQDNSKQQLILNAENSKNKTHPVDLGKMSSDDRDHEKQIYQTIKTALPSTTHLFKIIHFKKNNHQNALTFEINYIYTDAKTTFASMLKNISPYMLDSFVWKNSSANLSTEANLQSISQLSSLTQITQLTSVFVYDKK